MRSSNIQEGILGEETATHYLRDLGYKIIERNFKKRYGEIDIVAIDPSTSSGQVPFRQPALVFVEVKTRSSSQFGSPLEAITPWKLKSVIKTAQYYVLTHKNLPQLLRIDAVSVILGRNDTIENIEHIQNISGF